MALKRRELLATMAGAPLLARMQQAIPDVARIEKVSALQPGDVIVVECEGYISDRSACNIRTYLADLWPNNQVIVLGDGLRMKVLPGS